MMSWLKERVWQMGIGALLVLVGSLLIYPAAVSEDVNQVLLWAGLFLIFAGLAAPLIIRFLDKNQAEEDEEADV
jgi:uncharacterized membrane protein HdeD (DUF308 family)